MENQQFITHLVAQAHKTRGYLEKKCNNFFLSWQRRFFIVLNKELVYFLDDSLDERRGAIPLKDIKEVVILPDTHRFDIVTSNRTYQLRCSDAKKLREWTGCLEILSRFYVNQGKLTINGHFPQLLKWKTLLKKDNATCSLKSAYINYTQSESPIPEYMNKAMLLLRQRGLARVAEEFCTPMIRHRIGLMEFEEGIYFFVSCKSLQKNYQDDLILDKQYIQPYDFDTLYCLSCNQESLGISEVTKVKDISSLSILVEARKLQINDLQLTFKPISELTEVMDFVQKLKRSQSTGKEYHNQESIPLNKNVDGVIQIYDNAQESSAIERHETLRGRFELDYMRIIESHGFDPNRPCKYLEFSQVLSSLQQEIRNFLNAIRVRSGPQRVDVARLYVQFMHERIYKLMKQFWNQNHKLLEDYEFMQMANQVSIYRNLIKPFLRDNRLKTGIKTLIQIFFKKIIPFSQTRIRIILQNPDNLQVECQQSHSKLPEKFGEFLNHLIYSIKHFKALQQFTQDETSAVIRSVLTTLVDEVSLLVLRHDDEERVLVVLLNDVQKYYECLKNNLDEIGVQLFEKIQQKLYKCILDSFIKFIIDCPEERKQGQQAGIRFNLKAHCENIQKTISNIGIVGSQSLQHTVHSVSRRVAEDYLSSFAYDEYSIYRLLRQRKAAQDLASKNAMWSSLYKIIDSVYMIAYPGAKKEKSIGMHDLVEAWHAVSAVCRKNQERIIMDAIKNLRYSNMTEAEIMEEAETEALLNRLRDDSGKGSSTRSDQKIYDVLNPGFSKTRDHDQTCGSQEARLTKILSSQKTEFESYLYYKEKEKRRTSRKTRHRHYQLRYFKLEDYVLMCFSSMTCHDPISKIFLSDIESLQEDEQQPEKFYLECRKSGKTYQFRANSETLASRWIRSIADCLSAIDIKNIPTCISKISSGEECFKDGDVLFRPYLEDLTPPPMQVPQERSHAPLNFIKRKSESSMYEFDQQEQTTGSRMMRWLGLGCFS